MCLVVLIILVPVSSKLERRMVRRELPNREDASGNCGGCRGRIRIVREGRLCTVYVSDLVVFRDMNGEGRVDRCGREHVMSEHALGGVGAVPRRQATGHNLLRATRCE